MSTLNALQMMKLKAKNMMELEYDNMMIPHWTHYLSPYDVEELRKIATSKRLSGNMSEKLNRIKNIMYSRGFIRLAGGTNRIVFRYLEDPRFVAKVAIDSVGMSDNPAEFDNQWFIRPYCSKMFYVTDCGTVGFAERVLPITSKEEFKTAADDIFDILYTKIIGKYIIEDVGTSYFMNFGVRAGFGPVLLDYPYVYELDGATIICRNQLADGVYCGGEIDYDDGLNNLVCKKCGRKYLAREMKKNQEFNKIVISKGGNIPMNVKIKRGDKVIVQSNSCDFIINPNNQRKKIEDSMKNSTLKVNLRKNGEIYNPATKQEDNTPRVSYFGSDAKETMNNIMAQIKQNTQEEQEKKSVDNADNQETAKAVYRLKDDPFVAEEVSKIEEDIGETQYKSEDPQDVVSEAEEKIEVKEETEESTDPVTIKVPDKIQIDDKGRRIIGRTPRFIPDEVESEY